VSHLTILWRPQALRLARFCPVEDLNLGPWASGDPRGQALVTASAATVAALVQLT